MSSYKLRINQGWKGQATHSIDLGLARMATDIHRMAVLNAPFKTGALRNSGRFRRNGVLSWSVIFGNNAVPYAALREVENKKNPGTRFYLKRAGETATARAASYFGRI